MTTGATLAIAATLTEFDAATAGFQRVADSAKQASDQAAKAGQDATRAVTKQQADQQKAMEQTSRATLGLGKSFSAFAATVSGTAALLSLFARNNAELQQKLEVVAIGMAAAGMAARVLGAAIRFALTPIGLIVTAIAASIAIFLNWEKIQVAITTTIKKLWTGVGEFFSRLFGGIGEMAQGLGAILWGALTFNMDKVREGVAQLTKGFEDLKTVGVETAVALTEGMKHAAKSTYDFIEGLITPMQDLSKERIAGIVAAAEAELAEVEMIQKALVAIHDKQMSEQEALRQEGLASTLAAIEAEVEAYEDGLRAIASLRDKALEAEQQLRQQGLASAFAAIEAEVGAYEEGLRAIAALRDKQVADEQALRQEGLASALAAIDAETAASHHYDTVEGAVAAAKALMEAERLEAQQLISPHGPEGFVLQPILRPWPMPIRREFLGFRRHDYFDCPLFFTDGMAKAEASAFRRRHSGPRRLSLIFACHAVGEYVVALIWHPRYQVVVARDGVALRAVHVNPHHEALPTRDSEQRDDRLALAVYDRTILELTAEQNSYAGWLRRRLDRLSSDTGEAWLRRQLEGLDSPK